jgi:hypothetical protein
MLTGMLEEDWATVLTVFKATRPKDSRSPTLFRGPQSHLACSAGRIRLLE